MSTHNICFRREIRKILCGYPLLSVAMPSTRQLKCIMYQHDNICFYMYKPQLKLSAYLSLKSTLTIRRLFYYMFCLLFFCLFVFSSVILKHQTHSAVTRSNIVVIMQPV